MNANAIEKFRNPAIVREFGMSALRKELGVVGTTYFLRQFNFSRGNYTDERAKFLDKITFGEIVENVRKIDQDLSKA